MTAAVALIVGAFLGGVIGTAFGMRMAHRRHTKHAAMRWLSAYIESYEAGLLRLIEKRFQCTPEAALTIRTKFALWEVERPPFGSVDMNGHLYLEDGDFAVLDICAKYDIAGPEDLFEDDFGRHPTAE